MPKIKVDKSGVDALQRKFEMLKTEATHVAKRTVYDGAKVAADALRAATDSLQAVSDYDAINAKRRGELSYLSVKQKIGLQNGLGIATMRVTPDSVNTKVGFDGYNSVVTKRWPKGQPNRMVAAEVNHGSAGRTIRQPFITATAEVYAADIRKAMIQTATDEISKILEK